MAQLSWLPDEVRLFDAPRIFRGPPFPAFARPVKNWRFPLQRQTF